METYWLLKQIVRDGRVYQPGESIVMKPAEAQLYIRRGLMTDEAPKPPEPGPVTAYKVIRPVHDGEISPGVPRIAQPGEIIQTPSGRGDVLVAAGIVEPVSRPEDAAHKRKRSE